ncbi:MAG: Crp/Fnr family transcriptional regulator [Oscillospiraceae bacterium]|nr:Crp/Fnr family transcriptional regulator [Oscillospiraceae bacterium]
MTIQETERYLSAGFPGWELMTDNQRESIARETQEMCYEKGTYVHNGEENCIGAVLVVRGTLRVFMLSDEGREVTLYRIRAGSMCVLSASCVLAHIHFAVHVDASEDTTALIVPASFFLSLCAENVRVESAAYKLIAERFSEVMWTMQQLLFTSFDKRLAQFLIEEAAGAPDGVLHMTHEEVAKLTGSAREVVTRMLNYFAAEGAVELSRGGIRIADKKKLEAFARKAARS